MKANIIVQNLKCGGCASTITKGVSSIEGVSEVEIDVESSKISFNSESDNLEVVYTKLAHMGYPVDGDSNSFGQKAKSYVSCAIGRVTS